MGKISVPATDYARDIDAIFGIFTWICGSLLLVITITMLYFAWKYRRSERRTTKQIEGHLPLEITWIVIPTMLVMYMFYLGYEPFLRLRTVPPDAMIINVEASKWEWKFTYPEYGLTITGTANPDDLQSQPAIPVGTPVKFELTSIHRDKSVLHSFYLPDFRVKEDCIPFQDTYVCIPEVKQPTSTLEEGAENEPHTIFCAEFCGTGHSRMWTKLHVLSKRDFKLWIEARLAERNKPVVIGEDTNLAALEPNDAMRPDSPEFANERGKKVFTASCASCHHSEGTGGGAVGARDFTTLNGSAPHQKWKQGTKLTDIFRTISTGIPGTQMKGFDSMPAWDRFALMHYVGNFYKGKDRPAYTVADIKKLKAEFKLGGDGKTQRAKPISVEEAMHRRAGKSATSPIK